MPASARSSPTRMRRCAGRSSSGRRRLGSLARDEPAEGPLLRRGGCAVGARRSARARARGDESGSGRSRSPRARTPPARPDLGSWTDVPEPRESALLAGETGILLVAFRLAPSAELAETLHARVRENVHNEADEIMWGAPGTLDRRAAHARLDRRAAVARGVGRERGCCSRPPRSRRAVDAAAPRTRDALPRPRARARRKRPGARRRSSTRSVGRRSCAGRPLILERDRVRRGRPRELAARRARALGEHARRDPAAVVPRSARDPLRRRLLPRRGARARGRGAHVASRALIATQRARGSATARRGTATRC